MTRFLMLAAATLLGAGAARPALAQQFGAAAALDGERLLIAEPVRDDRGADVYIYARSGDRWVAVDTLRRPGGDGARDYFGRSLVVDGNTLFVGGTTFERSTGGVWQFRRGADGRWEPVGTLLPAEVRPGDSYGRNAVLSDGLLFVSALGHMQTGAVWVFRREGERWVEEAKLRPEQAAPQHFFGWSLAYDPQTDRLLVGAITPEPDGKGAAYVYRREAPGRWTTEATLLPPADAAPGYGMGTAVAWLRGRALVGAPGASDDRGEVRIYERGGSGEWSLASTLASPTEGRGSFGAALAARAGALWVGATRAERSGRVYEYTLDAGGRPAGDPVALAGIDGEVGDAFGGVLAVGDQVAVVGQVSDDYQLGSAIVMSRRADGWRADAKLVGPDPKPLAAITGDADLACAQAKADQFPCHNVDIRSFLPVQAIGGGRGAETNDVWGWTDPESGREYALVGRTDGTAFIDITNPNQPVYLGNLPKTPGSQSNSWRDIKVYANHAYVVADGALDHGMQVFDLTRLRNVQNAPATFTPDTLYTGIASAHNIVINEASGFAYAVGANSGGETCGGALHMIDIREPKRPRFAGCFADTRTGRAGTGYSHDAMCIRYDGPDREHAGKEICFGSNETALSIADVTDKANPKPISVADYPNVGYSHQGWITPDFKYFYMDDEGDESNSVAAGQPMPGTRTLIWDVQDLDDPVMVKEHFGETLTTDHNLYIKDNLMYQSNYVSGLRILDIRDPLNPVEVGYLDTVPWSEDVMFDGSWSNYPFFESGTLVVSSGKEGIFFLRYNPRPLLP